MTKTFLLFILLILCLISIPVQAQDSTLQEEQFKPFTDYSVDANWLNLPEIIEKVDTFIRKDLLRKK